MVHRRIHRRHLIDLADKAVYRLLQRVLIEGHRAFDHDLAFDLADELRPIYTRLGHALPDINGVDDWVLPLPATFVIAQNGTVALAFVEVDYRTRLEPAEIIATLRNLSGQVPALEIG